MCEIQDGPHILDYCPESWILFFVPQYLECGFLLSPAAEPCYQTLPFPPPPPQIFLQTLWFKSGSPFLQGAFHCSCTPTQTAWKGSWPFLSAPQEWENPVGTRDCGIVTSIYLPTVDQVGGCWFELKFSIYATPMAILNLLVGYLWFVCLNVFMLLGGHLLYSDLLLY